MKKEEEQIIEQAVPETEPKDPIVFLVDSVLAIEGLRIATQIRQSHLKLRGRSDTHTDDLLERLIDLEEYVDGKVAKMLKEHPAYHWFSQIKGIGKENIGKVVGLVDIKKAPTISSLWKYAGYAVENGHAPQQVKGQKLSYNKRLRTMCWRLGGSLLKAKGSFYDFYINAKNGYHDRFRRENIQIISAAKLPLENGKRKETATMISEGHVHNMALRKMIKLFLACLWLVWREAEGLDTRKPYAIDNLKHTTMIDPWEMVDRAEKPKKKKAGNKQP